MKVNVSWAFGGNAVYAACQWLVFVLLVRTLPLTEVGQFAYALAVTGPVFVLANLQLRNLLATGIDSPHGFGDYLAARLLTATGAIVVSLLIGGVFAPGLDSFELLALLAGAKACDSVGDICHGLYQRELDMRSAAISLMTNGLLSLALVALGMALWPTMRVATAAYAAGSAVTLVGWDLRRMRKYAQPAERHVGRPGTLRAAAALMRQAMPLGVSSALGSLRTNIPRYAVSASLGPAALGVFTALAYLTTLTNLIANATAQAALPLLARDRRTSRARYQQRLRMLVQAGVALGAVTVVGTLLVARPVTAAIYGKEVAGHHVLLIWLMAGAALTYGFLFLGTAATVRMQFTAQCTITACSTLAVGVSVLPLVSRYGLLGGAYALGAGALVEGCAYVALTIHDARSQAGPPLVDRGAMAEACGR